jgi:8-oxo-dGTP pyrophosphatase MutT (NUDIX family)
MHRNHLLQQLKQYQNSSLITSHELNVIDRFITFIQTNHHCFERSNIGHITSSLWLVNHVGTHALLTHHKKFNGWFQLGGHNDGDPNCQQTALKEALEESGIEGLTLITPAIFDIDLHPIPSACAYHYDVRYLLQAPAAAQYQISEESNDLQWVALDQLENYSKEASIMRMKQKYQRHFK